MEREAVQMCGQERGSEVVSSSERLQPALAFVAINEAVNLEELEWYKDALCAQTDPEAFYAEKGGSNRDAKKVCGGCDVKSQCLEYALDNDEQFGVWGGLSERERRKLRRRAA